MCGIVGYIGNEQAAPILLDGLSKLEYRGYDSAGIAVRDSDGNINIVKAKGRLKGLIEKLTVVMQFLEHVASGIQDGLHMVNHQRQMHIRI